MTKVPAHAPTFLVKDLVGIPSILTLYILYCNSKYSLRKGAVGNWVVVDVIKETLGLR